MRVRIFLFAIIAAVVVAACQGVQPTMLVMEVTREVPVTVIVTSVPTNGPVSLSSITPTTTPQGRPIVTATPSVTPTQDPFPTPVVGQVFVADQLFENGRMFWVQPVDQIWVLTTNSDGTNNWQVFNDTFEEGMLERDPEITPPATPNLNQPERGFGKLWRENPELRDALGWAVGEELGYTTRYEYHAGGEVNSLATYVPASGYHVLETLDKDVYTFLEGVRAWEVVRAGS
jgi:hypothetical protein